MKLEGVQALFASRDRVWDMLMDPEVLARCLPGCETLDPIGESSYRATLKIGIAAIKGSYQGSVTMSDLDPTNSFRITLEGNGSPGFVRGSASIHLGDQGASTDLRYSADVQVGGIIASVGQRMLQGITRSLLNQFFKSFREEIQSKKLTSDTQENAEK